MQLVGMMVVFRSVMAVSFVTWRCPISYFRGRQNAAVALTGERFGPELQPVLYAFPGSLYHAGLKQTVFALPDEALMAR